ncbi:uncharacterized protein LOC115623874 isoform X2 [Scaptodrosophila lebanonensis]|uniref:Uncharacterized protein LOC115623874 isoform X2 n=1 Tax=Drosophila lebanonensis TaxID=7225 RepID=A0A6J2TGY2_DROLE|nr:uncharacterized protein LOC115623874 isoform X2 [Scaptodrosophila lebanonensis]
MFTHGNDTPLKVLNCPSSGSRRSKSLYKQQFLEGIRPYLSDTRSVKEQLSRLHPNSQYLLEAIYINNANRRLQGGGCKIPTSKSWKHAAKHMNSKLLIKEGKTTPATPTDADIIFGPHNCKYHGMHCYSCGWDRSRIEWLHDLERQQQLRQAWREQNSRRTAVLTKNGKWPMKQTLREKRKKGWCSWFWWWGSCGSAPSSSDTESTCHC